ncbi:competence protein ComGE [Neobacillus niacini]|uniref:competence type IV pilus minor pilin ComGE n=1 Tax=Neobacillus niacini TaxID=86668 RepID=UPI00278422BC|nr:competence type IV pilus minor pilin ComGE [Neobacillus niacini]MDQ1001526.1 competence protein ComGE [Neobacillus niacini]
MLWKNDGFFLLELLLSLSAWFMMGMFFMPLLMELSNQSQQLVRDKKAVQFLYEELQANLTEDRTNSNYSILHNGTEYKIYWNQSSGTGQKEVCVKIEGNSFLPRTEICKVPE